MRSPQQDILDSRWTPVLSDIFNCSKFKYCAFSSLKVDRFGRKKGIQVGINKHITKERWLIVCLEITNHFSSILVLTNIYRFKFVNFLPIFGL